MWYCLYRRKLQSLLRNATYLFWSLFFPVILVILLQVVLQDNSTQDRWEPIQVAVIEDSKEAKHLIEVMKLAHYKEKNLFEVTILIENATNQLMNKGKQLVEKEKVKACIFLDKTQGFKPNLLVKSEDKVFLLLKTFIEQYPFENNFNFVEMHQKGIKFIEQKTLYFFILLGIVSLSGSYLGCKEVIDLKGDSLIIGMRMRMAPFSRKKIFFSHFFALGTIQLAAVILFIAFLYRIAKDIFSGNIFYIIFICILTAITGISFGTMIGASYIKNIKYKYLIIITMIIGGNVLAGMMIPFMQRKVIFLTFWNPSSIMLYALNEINKNKDGIYLYIGIFLMAILIFTIISCLLFKQKKIFNRKIKKG